MKDTKFYIQLSFIMILNVIMLMILEFLPLDKKDMKYHKDSIKNTLHSSNEFALKLEKIDKKIQKVEPAKKIKPIKVVVVKEQIKQKPKIVYVTKVKTVENKKGSKDIPIIISSQTIEKKVDIKGKENIYKKLEKKFYKSYSYDVALKLSRLYYLQKNYKKALKWTKIANELNNRDDKSWIMFAKIKIEQGNIKDAKRALNMYKNRYHSKEVDKLLKGLS